MAQDIETRDLFICVPMDYLLNERAELCKFSPDPLTKEGEEAFSLGNSTAALNQKKVIDKLITNHQDSVITKDQLDQIQQEARDAFKELAANAYQSRKECTKK